VRHSKKTRKTRLQQKIKKKKNQNMTKMTFSIQ
jgi:hypothetical protein